MSEEKRHASRFALNQLASGIPSRTRSAELDAHLAGCGVCRAALDELRANRERCARELIEPSMPQLLRRVPIAKGSAPSGWLRRFWLVPLPALALLMWVLLPRLAAQDLLRTKGSAPVLRVIAERGGSVFKAKEGEPLREGDRLRFTIDDPGAPYLLLASIDGEGKVSVYVPFEGEASLAIDPAARFVSSDAFQLDAAPGPERLFALLSRRPLAASEVIEKLRPLGRGGPEAIRKTRMLSIDVDRQISYLIEKVSR